MKQIIIKLIDGFNFKKIIRGILAIMVVYTACSLALDSKIQVATFMVLATAVIMFFFKREEKDEDDSDNRNQPDPEK